jgi:hypothetical protein
LCRVALGRPPPTPPDDEDHVGPEEIPRSGCTVLYMAKSDWDWYDDYERWVKSQVLTDETKRTYLVHVRRFIKWKEGSEQDGRMVGEHQARKR